MHWSASWGREGRVSSNKHARQGKAQCAQAQQLEHEELLGGHAAELAQQLVRQHAAHQGVPVQPGLLDQPAGPELEDAAGHVDGAKGERHLLPPVQHERRLHRHAVRHDLDRRRGQEPHRRDRAVVRDKEGREARHAQLQAHIVERLGKVEGGHEPHADPRVGRVRAHAPHQHVLLELQVFLGVLNGWRSKHAGVRMGGSGRVRIAQHTLVGEKQIDRA